MEDIGEFLVPYLPSIRVPKAEDRVYKDECCLSFDSPYSEGGLYVCLNSFLSFGQKHVIKYHELTGNSVFLILRKIPIDGPPSSKVRVTESEQPSRLAIGVEGGFQPEDEPKQEYEDKNSLVILPDFMEISLDKIEDIPAILLRSVQAVLSAESASKKEELMVWDGEIRPISKHADALMQLDNGIRIPPSGWKCSRCDLTNNLWVNITDGTILCGRRYFDGSGGNQHALEHFKETHYPLVVKLGTITATGADVYSYDEDDMVEDPKLATHLAHFGINMMNMEKTDKTMTELEIDLNKKFGNEWDLIQESGKQLAPRYGRGLTGMKNMGNTCYLNSTMQVLLSIPAVSEMYIHKSNELFRANIKNPMSDFNTQMSKLALGLNSGDYSHCPPKENSSHFNKVNGITPASIRRLIGRNHAEFSSNRQQDAQEYLLFVLNLMERHSRQLGENPINCFKFKIEDRLECMQSKKVKYSDRSELMVGLPIRYSDATNLKEVQEYNARKEASKSNKTVTVGDVVRAKIPFASCLDNLLRDITIDDFWSPALREKSMVKTRMRFKSFPDCLIIQLRKFTIGDDWVPKKLDVSIDMPDVLSLEEYRAQGLQENEELLPDLEPPKEASVTETVQQQRNIDETTVLQLVETGFPLESCRKAVFYTENCGAEVAMTWLMEHISDPDFADPLPTNQSSQACGAAAAVTNNATVSEDSIAMILAMGFNREQAIKALKATDNNLERAADWIFSHIDELDTAAAGAVGDVAGSEQTGASAAMDTENVENAGVRDGVGKYELFAFISHMGTSTMCGHYVCHIKKDKKWVIFNDEKVAESEDPPKSLGYLYFYRRLCAE